MGLVLFSGNSWKTLYYLEVGVWNIGETNECLYVEERFKTTQKFSKTIFLVQFFWKEFLMDHQCIVTFIMKFMCFPNNQTMSICGQVRVRGMVRVVAVSADPEAPKAALCPSLVIPEED